MKVILLSGGKGKRLFPLSREYYPKQYIPIFNGKSLLQNTIERFNSSDDIYILTNKNSYSFLYHFNKDLKLSFKTIFEPISKNTAASIEYALQFFEDEEICGVFPVDHLIEDLYSFQNCIKKALDFVDDSIVLIGIEPKTIETRFGYIEYENNNVISFKEKPSFELAKKYFESKRFLYNSGIFIFKKKVMQQEIQKFCREIYEVGEEIHKKIDLKNKKIEDFFSPDTEIEKIYEKFPSISIDYAVIEKTDKLKVIKGEFDWDDLGNIDSLTNKIPSTFSSDFGIPTKMKKHPFFEYSEKKNISEGKNKIEKDNIGKNKIGEYKIEEDKSDVNKTSENKIIGLADKIYGIIGYDDCKVIDTEDVLLIVKKGKSNQVENFYNWIEKDIARRDIVKFHKTVLKPWGYYKNLYEKENEFKVKIIKVNKGEQISLQLHHYREEYWTIIEGKGEIIIEDKRSIAEKGMQFYIPKNVKHQIIASMDFDIIFLEVQMGKTLSEDDIIRVEDKYKR